MLSRRTAHHELKNIHVPILDKSVTISIFNSEVHEDLVTTGHESWVSMIGDVFMLAFFWLFLLMLKYNILYLQLKFPQW